LQNPGNLGGLLRTAEAAGASGAYLTRGSADPFSWKALRGSMGSVLRLPIVAGITTHQAITIMRKAAMRTVAAVPRGGQDPDSIDWRGKVGLLLGGEGPGLTDEAIAVCDARVSVPMARTVESLNVSVAGAILVYAARRQRQP
jgi:TrmH family RNA methyltransferase